MSLKENSFSAIFLVLWHFLPVGWENYFIHRDCSSEELKMFFSLLLLS